MMKKKTRKRLLQEAAQARKEAAGDFSHLKDRKGNFKQKPQAQPTLPKVDLYEDESRYKRDYSSSDVSLRKDPLYFQSQTSLSHAYPPATGWRGHDGPQPLPAFGYESEVGYAGSVHSMDRLIQTPGSEHNDPYGNALGKAPSYRSQTSLHDSKKHWENHDAPPVPTHSSPMDHQPQYFSDYAQQPRSRSPGPNDVMSSGRRSPGPNEFGNGGRRSPGPNALDQSYSQEYVQEEYQVCG